MLQTFALPPTRKVRDATSLRAAVERAMATRQQAAPSAQSCGCTSAAADPCPRCAARDWAQVPIGRPDDALEAEAERAAGAIDRMATPVHDTPYRAGLRSGTNRSAASSTQTTLPERGTLADRSLGSAPMPLRHALGGGGTPLDAATRSHFERALGYDFGRVRVHADARAGTAARALSSRAFTWGHHVAFAPGHYAPHSAPGRHLLGHELVHVVQQSGRAHAAQALRAKSTEEEAPVGVLQTAGGGVQRMPLPAVSVGALGSNAIVQRDFALVPPHPAAVPQALTPQQLLDAIAFNERVVAVIGTDGIERLRDVLGISRKPAVIDQDFVEAVQRWQAVQGIAQDGRLGAESAGRLLVEIGAEKVGRAELSSGPTYRATTTLSPAVDAAGEQHAAFDLDAEFNNDPANGIYASCGEIRQFIQWDAASAAALPLGGRPHTGFPAGAAANTWIEDRDTVNKRYGHRRGPHAESISINTYLDTGNDRNAAFGHRYHGSDRPGGPDALLAGHWRFYIRAFDVCNGNKVLGTDYLRITW